MISNIQEFEEALTTNKDYIIGNLNVSNVLINKFSFKDIISEDKQREILTLYGNSKKIEAARMFVDAILLSRDETKWSVFRDVLDQCDSLSLIKDILYHGDTDFLLTHGTHQDTLRLYRGRLAEKIDSYLVSNEFLQEHLLTNLEYQEVQAASNLHGNDRANVVMLDLVNKKKNFYYKVLDVLWKLKYCNMVNDIDPIYTEKLIARDTNFSHTSNNDQNSGAENGNMHGQFIHEKNIEGDNELNSERNNYKLDQVEKHLEGAVCLEVFSPAVSYDQSALPEFPFDIFSPADEQRNPAMNVMRSHMINTVDMNNFDYGPVASRTRSKCKQVKEILMAEIKAYNKSHSEELSQNNGKHQDQAPTENTMLPTLCMKDKEDQQSHLGDLSLPKTVINLGNGNQEKVVFNFHCLTIQKPAPQQQENQQLEQPNLIMCALNDGTKKKNYLNDQKHAEEKCTDSTFQQSTSHLHPTTPQKEIQQLVTSQAKGGQLHLDQQLIKDPEHNTSHAKERQQRRTRHAQRVQQIFPKHLIHKLPPNRSSHPEQRLLEDEMIKADERMQKCTDLMKAHRSADKCMGLDAQSQLHAADIKRCSCGLAFVSEHYLKNHQSTSCTRNKSTIKEAIPGSFNQSSKVEVKQLQLNDNYKPLNENSELLKNIQTCSVCKKRFLTPEILADHKKSDCKIQAESNQTQKSFLKEKIDAKSTKKDKSLFFNQKELQCKVKTCVCGSRFFSSDDMKRHQDMNCSKATNAKAFENARVVSLGMKKAVVSNAKPETQLEKKLKETLIKESLDCKCHCGKEFPTHDAMIIHRTRKACDKKSQQKLQANPSSDHGMDSLNRAGFLVHHQESSVEDKTKARPREESKKQNKESNKTELEQNFHDDTHEVPSTTGNEFNFARSEKSHLNKKYLDKESRSPRCGFGFQSPALMRLELNYQQSDHMKIEQQPDQSSKS